MGGEFGGEWMTYTLHYSPEAIRKFLIGWSDLAVAAAAAIQNKKLK